MLNFSVLLAEARIRSDTVFLNEILEPILSHGWTLTYRKRTMGLGNPHEWLLQKHTVKVKITLATGTVMFDRTRIESAINAMRYLSRKEGLVR